MRFTSVFTSLVLLVCVSGYAADSAPPSSSAVPVAISHGPYLQLPADTSMTIVWATNGRCVSKVEYREAPDGPTKTAIPSHHGLVDANATVHRVTLNGLKPGTTYCYRAISTEIVDFKPYKVVFGNTVRSEESQFTTLDNNKSRFSFVVVNDRHEKVPELKAAMGAIKWDSIDLVFLNGDMVTDPSTEPQIQRSVVDPCVEFFATKIPFVYGRGNHETRGALARSFMNYFPTPNQHYYYSLQHGGVYFLMLDAGEDKADTSSEYSGLADFESYLKEETEWLRQEIQSKAFRKARFRVVLIHIPPGEMYDPKFIREKWVLDNWGPLFNKNKVNLVLSGHTHVFADQPPRPGNNDYHLIVGGTDTVIRADVQEDRLNLTVTDNEGTKTLTTASLKRK
jgi:predicted phosphodiesterase